MVPKQTAEGPRRRLIYRNHHPLLLSLLLTVQTGSAFIQLPIHAYAMSDTAYSGSGNSAKPLSAQLEGDNDNNESETSNNGAEETLLLPESSGDPSIPSIKLGGTRDVYIMCTYLYTSNMHKILWLQFFTQQRLVLINIQSPLDSRIWVQL